MQEGVRENQNGVTSVNPNNNKMRKVRTVGRKGSYTSYIDDLVVSEMLPKLLTSTGATTLQRITLHKFFPAPFIWPPLAPISFAVCPHCLHRPRNVLALEFCSPRGKGLCFSQTRVALSYHVTGGQAWDSEMGVDLAPRKYPVCRGFPGKSPALRM